MEHCVFAFAGYGKENADLGKHYQMIARSENRETGETGGTQMVEKTVRLLLAAGILMILAGCIFGFINQWIYAALVWVGAFGCCVAALNFKNRKSK